MTLRQQLLLFLAVAGGVLLVSCDRPQPSESPPSAGRSSVWLVEKEGNRLYLAGTIHLLRAADYPLPAIFDHAYEQSSRLVFELPPGAEAKGEIVGQMRRMGTYPAGESLEQHVSADTLQQTLEWAGRRGFPASAIQQMRPWFLSLTVAAVEYQLLGAESERGVDSWFEQRAGQDGKHGEGLETVEFQLGIFAGLSPKLQEELLRQTFAEIDNLPRDYEALISAWKTGDAGRIQEFLFRDADKYPELMEAFLVRRNMAWADPILKTLESGETAMVLVGAGHMGGEGGLLEILQARGCTISQPSAQP